MKTTLTLTLAFLLVATAPAADPVQSAHRIEKQISLSLDYLLYLPPAYTKDITRKWPLLLFLHGAGERGTDLERVKIHGPPKLVETGKDFPFIIVSPQCPEDQWWDLTALTHLLDEIQSEHRVDPDRIYLTGLSMGGFGTWNLASLLPEKFAAIAPVCGGGFPIRTKNLRHLPVWAFHGARDKAVPLSESVRMVDALRKRGNRKVVFSVYADAGHDSWTATYDNPRFYEWLLSHTRRPPSKSKN